MRQVFTSPRLENVEGVARVLEDAGIEVRITHGRSYKGGWSGRRSYRESAQGEPQPAVWVVKSEDQPRARQILRAAGLLDSTRMPADSYLGPSLHDLPEPRAAPTPERRAFRFKLWLLVAIAVVLVLAYGAMRKPTPETSAPATAARAARPATPAQAAPAPTWPVDTPPALAQLLATAELDAHAPASACLSVDERAPPAELLAALGRDGLTLVAGPACAADIELRLAIGPYLTDGSGSGTVRLTLTAPGPDGRPATQARTLHVQRQGERWRVLRVLEVR